MLQANVHALRAGLLRTMREWQEAGRHRELRDDHLTMAEEAFPENPRVQVLRGIERLANPATRDEGRAILERAKQLYEQPLPSPLWPNWGREWIDHWLARYEEDGR